MRSAVSLFLLVPALLAQGDRPKRVVTAAVVEREVAATRSFVGTVRPVRETTVGAESAGLVIAFSAEEGRTVEANEVLAQLRTDTIDLEIAAARAELELRRQELAELSNGTRPETIEEAQARLAEAEAEVELRRWKAGNAQRLFESNTIAEDELKEARLAIRGAEQRAAALNAQLRLAQAGPRAERIAQAAARVKMQQAQLARLDLRRRKLTVRALFAGVVVAKRTEVGAWIGEGDPVVDLIALDEVDVTIAVLEDYVPRLTVGTAVPVRVGAATAEPLDGRLDAIVPRADVRARTFPVKVRVKNREENGSFLLKSGMLARIDLAVGEKQRALLVPKDAIVLGGPQPVVWVVAENSTASPVTVATGLAHDDYIVVTGKLTAGQEVVTRGNERLMKPGQEVTSGPGR